MIPNSRECTKCHKNKLLINFRAQKKGRYGKKAVCIPCDDLVQKERYQEKQKEIIEQVREYQENASEEIKAKIKKYKKDYRERKRAEKNKRGVQKSPPPNR